METTMKIEGLVVANVRYCIRIGVVVDQNPVGAVLRQKNLQPQSRS